MLARSCKVEINFARSLLCTAILVEEKSKVVFLLSGFQHLEFA